MNKLLLLLLFPLLFFGQMPNTADSVYWSSKYCDTGNTYEEYLTQWTWNGNVQDCIQPSEGMVNAFYNEKTGNVLLYLLDSYDCCCKVASLPGSTSVWNFFMGSSCQEYLDSIGFIYNDPDFINWTSVNEDVLELNGIYIDPFGRQYTTPPKGLSIKNKTKYYRL